MRMDLQSTDFDVSEHQMLPQFSSFVLFFLSSSNTPPTSPTLSDHLAVEFPA